MQSLRRTGSTDVDQAKLEKYLNEYLQQLADVLPLNGRQIDNIALTTGQSNIIEHGLGRVLRGYQVGLKSADSNVWDSQASNLLSAKTLILNCDANCVVSLWVY